MLESLLIQYGYPILLIGTFFEGETILVLGGVAAQMGYLSLDRVIACGFAGTLLGDQLYFLLGRRYGPGYLASRPAWQARSQKVYRIMERHPVLLILGFRFLYGLRTVTPFAIGMSNISYLRFALLNLLGAGLWAGLIALAGYYFGHGVALLIGDIQHYELEVLTLVGGIGLCVWGIYLFKHRNSDG